MIPEQTYRKVLQRPGYETVPIDQKPSKFKLEVPDLKTTMQQQLKIQQDPRHSIIGAFGNQRDRQVYNEAYNEYMNSNDAPRAGMWNSNLSTNAYALKQNAAHEHAMQKLKEDENPWTYSSSFKPRNPWYDWRDAELKYAGKLGEIGLGTAFFGPSLIENGLVGGLARIGGGYGGSFLGEKALGYLGGKRDERFGTSWRKPTGEIVGGLLGWGYGSGAIGRLADKGVLEFARRTGKYLPEWLINTPTEIRWANFGDGAEWQEQKDLLRLPQHFGSRKAYTAPKSSMLQVSPRTAFASDVKSESPTILENLPIYKDRFYRYFNSDALNSYRINGVISSFDEYGDLAARFQYPLFSKGTTWEGFLKSPGMTWAISKPGSKLQWKAVHGAAQTPLVNGEFNKAPISEFDFYTYAPGKGYVKLNENLELPEGITISETPHIDYLRTLPEQQQLQYLIQNGLNKEWLQTLKYNPTHLESALRDAPLSGIEYGYASPTATRGTLKQLDNFIENDVFPRLQRAGHNVTYDKTTMPILRQFDPARNPMDKYLLNNDPIARNSQGMFHSPTNTAMTIDKPSEANYGLLAHEIPGHAVRYNINSSYKPVTPEVFTKVIYGQPLNKAEDQILLDWNNADQLYTPIEESLLKTSYGPFFKGGEAEGKLHDYGAVNTQLRALISQKNNYAVDSKLDPYIDNFQDVELLKMLLEQPYTKNGTIQILKDTTGLKYLDNLGDVELTNILSRHPELSKMLKRIKDTMKYVAGVSAVGIGMNNIPQKQ